MFISYFFSVKLFFFWLDKRRQHIMLCWLIIANKRSEAAHPWKQLEPLHVTLTEVWPADESGHVSVTTDAYMTKANMSQSCKPNPDRWGTHDWTHRHFMSHSTDAPARPVQYCYCVLGQGKLTAEFRWGTGLTGGVWAKSQVKKKGQTVKLVSQNPFCPISRHFTKLSYKNSIILLLILTLKSFFVIWITEIHYKRLKNQKKRQRKIFTAVVVMCLNRLFLWFFCLNPKSLK